MGEVGMPVVPDRKETNEPYPLCMLDKSGEILENVCRPTHLLSFTGVKGNEDLWQLISPVITYGIRYDKNKDTKRMTD